MKHISNTWFVEEPIDEEYKQYILLDFLQGVEVDFAENKLYPPLSELIEHLKVMELFSLAKNEMLKGKRSLKGIDWSGMKLEYEPAVVERNLLGVEAIVNFAIPKMQKVRDTGINIWESLCEQIKWSLVGVVPQYVDEGYFIIHIDKRHIVAYRYNYKNLILDGEEHCALTCEPVYEIDSKLKRYESIKTELIKRMPDLPVPMTFSIEVPEFPFEESVMPIVKRVGISKIDIAKKIYKK